VRYSPPSRRPEPRLAQSELGFLQSARARAKVRHWFSEQNLDDSVAQGRTLLDRELHRIGVTDINQEKLAQKLNYNKLDDLLAALDAATSRRAV